MLQEPVFGNNSSTATRFSQLSQGGEQVKQQVNSISYTVRE